VDSFLKPSATPVTVPFVYYETAPRTAPPRPGTTPRVVAFEGLGFSGADLQRNIISGVMPLYQEQVRRYQPWLRAKGKAAGKSIAAAIKGAPGAVGAALVSKPDGPGWMDQFIDPVIDPFIDGLKSEALPAVVGGGAALAGTLALVGFVLGRLSNR
jgi:hypothetical protein